MKKLFVGYLIFIIWFSMCNGEPLQLGFTYQGILEDGGIPADGPYDMSFKVFDDPFAGIELDEGIVLDNVAVNGGVFTVELQFSPSVFTGMQVWMEIMVRPGASIDPADFIPLGPRQKISPVPYSLYSLAAGTVRHGMQVRMIPNLPPNTAMHLGRVFFGYSFRSPPAVTISGHLNPFEPLMVVPQVGNVDPEGFDLVLLNVGDAVYNEIPYGFNWIAVGEGSELRTFFKDLDHDGFSDGTRIESYEGIPGYSLREHIFMTDGDCDDTDPNINPSVPETWYDGIDQNCDGRSDYDQDMDGFDVPDDCNDTNRWIHPGAMELCNGIDDNCDGLGDTGCVDRPCSDEMSEFFGIVFTDCLNSGRPPEECFLEAVSLIGYPPCEDALLNILTCDEFINACFAGDPSTMELCLWITCPQEYHNIFGAPEDADDDGFNRLHDCDDDNPDIYPGAEEIPNDGIDQNCDGFDTQEVAAHLLPGDLVITEIMQNPAAVDDSLGEWFEIINMTGKNIDLNGLRILSNASEFHQISTTVMLPAGAILVLGHLADPAQNGGAPVGYAYGGDINLANTSDFIELWNTDGSVLIDGVAYDDGATFPNPTGSTMSLEPGATDATANDLGTHWCITGAPYGAGDIGTPGAPNPPCP